MPDIDTDVDADKSHRKVLSYHFSDKKELYRSYMPFIKEGALFIVTPGEYHLNDEIFLLLQLFEEPEKFPIAGRVVWLTPKGAQNNQRAGIGVQFLHNDAEIVRNKIETYLAGFNDSDEKTDTL